MAAGQSARDATSRFKDTSNQWQQIMAEDFIMVVGCKVVVVSYGIQFQNGGRLLGVDNR